ncbi:MAG: phenylalanine--tRNA ligase subunit beta [Watsoniomyces obsoletus]|nr:MAG: phenylalanine--tRNA ligase subunit beta [Watsoniomyces obsoletus]
MQKIKNWIRTSGLRWKAESSSPATLDGLPMELTEAILEQVPDIATLNALIQASPGYYRAYKRRRLTIQQTVLWRELTHHADIVDVMAAVEASELDLHDSNLVKTVREVLWNYHWKRHSVPANDSTSSVRCLGTFQTWLSAGKPLDTSRMTLVLRLRQTMNSLVNDFCRWIAQASLPPSLRTVAPKRPFTPSMTETRRMKRAFYRYEILRCLFGPGLQRIPRVGLEVEAARYLTKVLRGWESEEVACVVVDYVEERWTQVLESYHVEYMYGMFGYGRGRSTPFATRIKRDRAQRRYKRYLTSLTPRVLLRARKEQSYKYNVPPFRSMRRYRDHIDRIRFEETWTNSKTAGERTNYFYASELYRGVLFSFPYALQLALRAQAPDDFVLPTRRWNHGLSPFPSWSSSIEPVSAAWIWATECSDNGKRFDNRWQNSAFRRNALVMWDDERLKTWMAEADLDVLTYLNRTRQLGIRQVLTRGWYYHEVDDSLV